MKRSLGYLCIALFASQPMASLASDLDLSSTAPAYQSTDVPGANGAVIVQGGHATTLGSSLTAAQYVAFMQSTSPTGQQLVLNGTGSRNRGLSQIRHHWRYCFIHRHSPRGHGSQRFWRGSTPPHRKLYQFWNILCRVELPNHQYGGN